MSCLLAEVGERERERNAQQPVRGWAALLFLHHALYTQRDSSYIYTAFYVYLNELFTRRGGRVAA